MSKKELDFNDKLIAIQKELKAPKNQRNNFGKYNYRSCEDILESVKPLLSKYALALTISDEIKELGSILFAEATVTLGDMEAKVSVKAQAGIDPNRKGMDIAQSFGSSSSYARKYALNGLFLIDDTKDADSNKEQTPTVKAKPVMTTDIYNAMLEAINTGKSDQVKSKMNNYQMTQRQSDKLTELIK